MQKSGLCKIGFIALLFSPLLMGGGQVGGGGGCGGGAITNTTSTSEGGSDEGGSSGSPALTIEPSDTTTVGDDGVNLYAAVLGVTDPSVTWEVVEGESSGLVKAIGPPPGVVRNHILKRRDEKGIGLNLTPDPSAEDQETTTIRCCLIENPSVCDEQTLTIVKGTSNSLGDLLTAPAETLGFEWAGVTVIETRDWSITVKTRLDLPASYASSPAMKTAALAAELTPWTWNFEVCGGKEGTVFSPKCVRVGWAILKSWVEHLVVFENPADGCPDTTQHPVWRDTNGGDIAWEDGFVDLDNLKAQWKAHLLILMNQVCAPNMTEADIDWTDFGDTFLPALLDDLDSNTLARNGQCLEWLGAMLTQVEPLVEAICHAGVMRNPAGVPYDCEKFYRCITGENLTGKTASLFQHLEVEGVWVAYTAADGSSMRTNNLGTSSTNPVSVPYGSTNRALKIRFNGGVNTDSLYLGTSNTRITVKDQNKNSVTLGSVQTQDKDKQITIPLSSYLGYGTTYTVTIWSGIESTGNYGELENSEYRYFKVQ